jgi:hypothetical protein
LGAAALGVDSDAALWAKAFTANPKVKTNTMQEI